MSAKLTVLWKGSGSAGASPQALTGLVSGNVVQGIIQQSGRAAAVTLKRDDLEKLLTARSGGAHSALQSVKDAYAEIGMMREESVSWAEIAELLGQNGAVGRDGKPFAAATVRAAFFLVGAEVRQGQLGDEPPLDSFADPLPAADEPPVAGESPSGYEPAELPPLPPLELSEPEPVPEAVVSESVAPESEALESGAPESEAFVEPERETVPEPGPAAESEPAPEPEPELEPESSVFEAFALAEASIDELIPEDEAAAEVAAEAEPESEPELPPPPPPSPLVKRPAARSRDADMWLMRPVTGPVADILAEVLVEDEPVAPVVVRKKPDVKPVPVPKPEPAPLPVIVPPPAAVVTAPAAPPDKSQFTHATAMSYDWWAKRY